MTDLHQSEFRQFQLKVNVALLDSKIDSVRELLYAHVHAHISNVLWLLLSSDAIHRISSLRSLMDPLVNHNHPNPTHPPHFPSNVLRSLQSGQSSNLDCREHPSNLGWHWPTSDLRRCERRSKDMGQNWLWTRKLPAIGHSNQVPTASALANLVSKTRVYFQQALTSDPSRTG